MFQVFLSALTLLSLAPVYLMLSAPSRPTERAPWIPTVYEVPFATFDTTGMF